jgi:hypothetical protein
MTPDRRTDREKDPKTPEHEDSISYFERTMNEALENSMGNTDEAEDR